MDYDRRTTASYPGKLGAEVYNYRRSSNTIVVGVSLFIWFKGERESLPSEVVAERIKQAKPKLEAAVRKVEQRSKFLGPVSVTYRNPTQFENTLSCTIEVRPSEAISLDNLDKYRSMLADVCRSVGLHTSLSRADLW